MFERFFNFSVKLRGMSLQCFSIEIRLEIRKARAAMEASAHDRRAGPSHVRREAIDELWLFQNAVEHPDATR
jgi:hypothetical protein